jgi:hypothetical protein
MNLNNGSGYIAKSGAKVGFIFGNSNMWVGIKIEVVFRAWLVIHYPALTAPYAYRYKQ